MRLERLNNLLRRMGLKDSRPEVFLGRRTTHDAAFTFHMLAGFPGMASRPGGIIEPCLNDGTNGATLFGQAVLTNGSSNDVRVPASGDSSATTIYGVTVRPFPFQVASATNYGAVALGTPGAPVLGYPVDVMRQGYMTVILQGSTAAQKGGQPYLCIVAGTGYVVGQFSADNTSGTFIQPTNVAFNGPADASGNVEIVIRLRP